MQVSVDEVIALLEAAETGSRKLDILIEHVLGAALGGYPRVAQLLLDESFSEAIVAEVLDDEIRSYTRSLDAALPEENIQFVMYSAKRGRWLAMHRGAQGEEVLGWGASESLARRTAALKARKAKDGRQDVLERIAARRVPMAREPDSELDSELDSGLHAGPGDPVEPAGEWKISF